MHAAKGARLAARFTLARLKSGATGRVGEAKGRPRPWQQSRRALWSYGWGSTLPDVAL